MKTESQKMMLAFVVRQCAVELGHPPDANELAEWANHPRVDRGRVFGRAISIEEARLIMGHPDRLVAVHPDWPTRRAPSRATAEPAKVIELRSLRRAR